MLTETTSIVIEISNFRRRFTALHVLTETVGVSIISIYCNIWLKHLKKSFGHSNFSDKADSTVSKWHAYGCELLYCGFR